jgi:DNA-binding transcriptional LysR family regulator
MELRHLHSFVAVAEEQSFTRAAARMHIAQPPLSLRIRELENELGCALFERSTRRVALTVAGRSFLDALRPALLQLDRAAESCRRAARGEIGTLRLGYTGRASYLLLPELLRSFRASHPEISVDLYGPHPSGQLRADLLGRNIDAALCFLPTTGPGLTSRTLAHCTLAIVLPGHHPLAGKPDLATSDLADEAFVGYPANRGFHLRSAMEAECLRAGFRPRVIRESEASQALLCLVAAGAGVSIIPDEIELLGIQGVCFRVLPRDAEAPPYGLVWSTNNDNPALHHLLRLDAVKAIGNRGARRRSSQPSASCDR